MQDVSFTFCGSSWVTLFELKKYMKILFINPFERQAKGGAFGNLVVIGIGVTLMIKIVASILFPDMDDFLKAMIGVFFIFIPIMLLFGYLKIKI